MLRPLVGLPDGVMGFEAEGTVTGDDYRLTLRPLLEQTRRQGDAVRLLFQLGSEFESLTKEAAWEDLRLGLEYLHDFERCALVTDDAWARAAAKLAGAMVRCEVRTYADAERTQAIRWLTRDRQRETLSFRLLPECEVLLVEPTSDASSEDFARVRDAADQWIEADGKLRALVIHADDLSAWEHPGTVLSQWQLIRDQHRELDRVAVAVGGSARELISTVGHEFANAEVKHFAPEHRAQAIQWAAGRSATAEIHPVADAHERNAASAVA